MADRPIDVRPISTEDLDVVHTINEAEVPAVGTVTADELARLVEQTAIGLVAVDGDEVAGFCLVLAPGADYHSPNYRWFHERYEDFVYLDRIAVAPSHQRRGIGRLLYDEVERLAAEQRPTATDFCLEVNLEPRNDDSLAFHARLGFVEVGQLEHGPGKRVSMMTRGLA